jgi:hypothetical protein
METGTSIRTNGIRKLTGADNYQTWETKVEYLHISIDAEEIVLENLQPPSDATAEELRLNRKIFKNALAILIKILALQVIAACPHPYTPHQLSIHIRSLNYQKTAFTAHA